MMQPEHDLYCDESHLPRQQCNDALMPPGVRAAQSEAAHQVDAAAAADPEPAVREAPASSVLRDAVTEAGMPEPTVYVSREWERTQEAVSPRLAGDAVPEDAPASASPRRIAMAVLAIAVVLLTVRRVRGRRGERR